MKQFIQAYYSEQGITLETKQDETMMRNAIMRELTSLVNQRRHWMMQKHGHQLWFHQTFGDLDAFCRDFEKQPLGSVCAAVLRLEGKFTAILPNPTGKHSCRFINFQFIIKISTAILNAKIKHLPGNGKRQGT